MRKRPFLLLATEFLLGIVCVREQLPAWGVLAVLLLVYTTPWKERGMRKVLFAAGLPGMFLLGMLQMQRQIDFRQQYLQKLTDGQEVRLAGKIDRIEAKTRCVYYYLKDCTVEAESQTLPCNDVIAYVSSASHSAGQILNIEGTISLFTEASNEGMFDARQFYQSQKIDFGIWVTKISRVYGKPDRYRCALQNMKKRANDVIRHSIRDDGVLSAMLLGEKGALDAEIKSLYQRAGIAHVLAISGVKTLKLDIPLVPETRINWAFVPLHIAIIYILKLCLDEEIIPRCRFPCSRGYLIKCINWQKKQSFSVRLILWQKSKNWQKEKMNMAYKKYREMKVYEASGYQYKRTPSIVLKGQWLSELGFDIGEQIEVKCEDGRLIITKANEIWSAEI